MKRYRRTAVSQYLVVAIVLAAVIGFGLLSMLVMSEIPFTDYFVIPWAAGRSWLIDGVSPYESSVIELAFETIQESSFQAQLPESQVVTQPILTLLFYLPFSVIPYSISRIIWVTLIGICVGLIGLLSIRLSGWNLSRLEIFAVILILVFWPPGVEAILGGHLAPMIIVLLLIGIHLISIEQDTTAGLILSLTASSFISSGLVLLSLLIWGISKKRWSLISGFISGFIFLLLLSWLIIPSWFLSWFSTLFNAYEGWGWVITPLMELTALLPGIESFLSIFLHAIFIIYFFSLLITILGKIGRPFIYKLSAIFVAAYLLHTRAALYHLLLVVPGMLLVFRFWSERWGLSGKLFSWLLFILIGVGAWVLIYPKVNFTTPVDAPLISIGFALFVFIGLIWIRWWALNVPQLPYKGQ
jgi:hypothetical protein